jgi:hypothetical protein
MSTFDEYVSKWLVITQQITNYMKDTDVVISSDYLNLLNQYKETIDNAKDALYKDDTIINKDKEWATYGFDCYDIFILPFISYGTKNGVDIHTIINILQSDINKIKTPDELEIEEFLEKMSIEDPDKVINELFNTPIYTGSSNDTWNTEDIDNLDNIGVD